nr:glycosyltransferase family 2 protein [uncultured Bacteroides sp.]
MPWYTNYIEVYEKPLSSVPQTIIAEVQSKLKERQSEEPLISVVLIAHNEEKRLLACLWSLCNNKCDLPIEILAVNNCSTDGTTEVLNELGVTWFDEKKKGPGHARQCGLDHAKGVYHICIDADTMYPPLYIQTHVRQLMKPEVACTFSLWSFIPIEGKSRIGLFFYEALRDMYLGLQSINRPELCVRGMVFGFKTEYARRIGFRTDIIRGEDGSLALGMKPYGKLKLITSRKARAITGYGTVGADGSLLKSFGKRFIRAVKSISGLFTRKEQYKDEEENLIK